MASPKLKAELSSGSVQDIYVFLNCEHLRGVRHPQLEKQLPEPYQRLLELRALVRRGGTFRQIQRFYAQTICYDDSFLKAEALMSFGFFQYQKGMYETAIELFNFASQIYLSVQFLSKFSIAKYNVAQCLEKLGKSEEAIQVENQVLVFAEENGLVNVSALCLRSRAFRAFSQGNIIDASNLFEGAAALFKNIGNTSDEATSLLFSLVLALYSKKDTKENIDEKLYRQSGIFQVNARSRAFYQAVLKISRGAILSTLDLTQCEEDAVRVLQFVSTHSMGRMPSGRKRSLSHQLLGFLSERSHATPEECIEFLWNNKGSWESLRQRLYTLISRINSKTPIIVFGVDQRYRIK